MIDLQKLKALAEAATPGPWAWDGRTVDQDGYVHIPECSYVVGLICLAGSYEGYQEDCDHIAAFAPDTALAMIARIAELEAQLAAADVKLQQREPRKPTDISAQLREYAGNPGYSHSDYADTMRRAADECERFYGGMMNWKGTAEAMDLDFAKLRAQLAQSDARTLKAVEAMKRRCLDTAEMSASLNNARGEIFKISTAAVIARSQK